MTSIPPRRWRRTRPGSGPTRRSSGRRASGSDRRGRGHPARAEPRPDDRHHHDRPAERPAAANRDRLPQLRRSDLHQRVAVASQARLDREPRGRSSPDAAPERPAGHRGPARHRPRHHRSGRATGGADPRRRSLATPGSRRDGQVQPAHRGQPSRRTQPPDRSGQREPATTSHRRTGSPIARYGQLARSIA